MEFTQTRHAKLAVKDGTASINVTVAPTIVSKKPGVAITSNVVLLKKDGTTKDFRQKTVKITNEELLDAAAHDGEFDRDLNALFIPKEYYYDHFRFEVNPICTVNKKKELTFAFVDSNSSFGGVRFRL